MPCGEGFEDRLIDVRDSGAVGARILIDPAPHAGKTYVFTGTPTNFGDFVDMFSSVLAARRQPMCR